MRKALMTWPQVAVMTAVFILLGTASALWQLFGPRAVTVTAGSGPEELVYVRSSDDIINGGTIFMPPKESTKPIAMIWIHGWGVNFYYPTSSIARQSNPARVSTFMIKNADHMYTGQEAQVARVIVDWADSIVLLSSGSSERSRTP